MEPDLSVAEYTVTLGWTCAFYTVLEPCLSRSLSGKSRACVLLDGERLRALESGAHWGQATAFPRALPINLFITSNVAAVALWLGASFLETRSEILLLILVFLGLLAIDHRLKRADLLEHGYFRTRVIATTIVVLCLIMLLGHAA